MTPADILLAIWLTASNPLEHILLMAKAVELSWNPAKYIAILTYMTPDPDYTTFPMMTSSTLDGSNLALSQAAFKSGATMSSTGVSLKLPLIKFIFIILY